jgi:hypothetical protein
MTSGLRRHHRYANVIAQKAFRSVAKKASRRCNGVDAWHAAKFFDAENWNYGPEEAKLGYFPQRRCVSRLNAAKVAENAEFHCKPETELS